MVKPSSANVWKISLTDFAKRNGGLISVIIGLLLLYAALPLGTAFQFSEDEGFEVMKPFLCNKGFVLYTEIWSDQPPMFTLVLAAFFKAFGPTILTARLVVAGFGLVLFACFYEIIRRRSGQRAALLASFFLLAAPGVLLLSVSAMQEIPTMSMGLLSAWLASKWGQRKQLAWLIFSGAALGLAIQIKLTAVLLAPAILIEFLLQSSGKSMPTWKRETMLRILIWGTSVVVVLSVIGLTWGRGSFEISLKSHLGGQAVPGLDRIEDHKFETKLLWMHMECLLAAGLGVIIAFSRKRFREIAFPVTLLMTDSIIHVIHKPWWNYYYLHLAIPVGWLVGWTINEIVQGVLQRYGKRHFNLKSGAAWGRIGLCALVAVVIARSERRLEGSVKDLHDHPRIDADPLVQEMRKYTGRVKWVYAEPVIYAFHTQIPVPPELAVVSPKRFWSGQITTQKIIAICKRYDADMLLLPMPTIRDEIWNGLLSSDYVKTKDADKSSLHLVKKMPPVKN